MSDLHTKINDNEDEKQSLVTALKIMQADLQRKVEPVQQHSTWEVQKGKTKRKKTPVAITVTK